MNKLFFKIGYFCDLIKYCKIQNTFRSIVPSEYITDIISVWGMFMRFVKVFFGSIP